MEDLNLGLSSRSHNIFLMAIHLYHDPLLLYRTSDPEVSGREAVTLLDSYRGIGPKIAGCVALMSLEKLDAFPVDRWMQRASCARPAAQCCHVSNVASEGNGLEAELRSDEVNGG